MAYLAVRGVDTLRSRATLPVAAALSAAGLWIAMPPVMTFARVGNPAQQALEAVEERLARQPDLRLIRRGNVRLVAVRELERWADAAAERDDPMTDPA